MGGLHNSEHAAIVEECLYRREDGLKCAIGALIPDEEYRSSFEGNAVRMIYKDVPALQSVDLPFLQDLQFLHDDHDPPYWPRELKRFAAKYEVDAKVLEEFE